MAWRALADFVLIVHFAFVVFIGVGALLAWRWSRLVWLHVPCLAWGVGIVLIGFDCPLTPLEKHFRRLGDEDVYKGGFIDRYIEDVVYPEELTPLLRSVAAILIAIGYGGLLVKRRRSPDAVATPRS